MNDSLAKHVAMPSGSRRCAVRSPVGSDFSHGRMCDVLRLFGMSYDSSENWNRSVLAAL